LIQKDKSMSILFWFLIVFLVIIIVYLGVGAYAAATMTRVGEHPQYDQDQIKKDLTAILESEADGIVISWDLWHIKTEHLLTIKDVINTQVF